jgi:hypothetical protein
MKLENLSKATLIEFLDQIIGKPARVRVIDGALDGAFCRTGHITLEEALILCDTVLEVHEYSPLTPAILAVAMTLHGMDWALCGGLAVGVLTRPRATVDIDIITSDRSTVLSKLLQSKQFIQKGSKMAYVSGGEIDVLDTNSGYWNTPKQVSQLALDTSRQEDFFGQKIPVVTPAGLVATKLGRAFTNLEGADQDKVDIISVLREYGKQDLSQYDLTTEMAKEYERLIARAADIRSNPQ